MRVLDLDVKYLLEGVLTSTPTKMFYEYLDEYEDEFKSIYLEVEIENKNIQSEISSSLEMSIQSLEYNLPDNVHVACCQSCKYGNFNPFGDQENEIFCFKGLEIHSKEDVVNLVLGTNSEQVDGFDILDRKRPLLHFCKDYEAILPNNEQYAYNDWVDGRSKNKTTLINES